MKHRFPTRGLAVALIAPVLFVADLPARDAPARSFVREAHALVGAPLTPMSYAGVARRTTRRVVYAETAAVAATAAVATTAAATSTAAAQQQAAAAQQQQAAAAQQQAAAQKAAAPAVGTVVPALPSGCTPMSAGGVEYYRCGSVYYRAAFQGNNLAYVTVQQP